MRWGINKVVNRNLRKDVIVTVVCIVFFLVDFKTLGKTVANNVVK